MCKNNISIVVPTKNRLDSFKKSINSIINQSTLPAEIIIADAGSTDGTLDYCKNLMSKLKNIDIKIVHEVKRYNNWKNGIESAKSNIVVILCDDDILHNKYIERINSSGFEKSNSVLYSSRLIVVDYSSKKVSTNLQNLSVSGALSVNDSIFHIMNNWFPGFPTIAIKKEFFDFSTNGLSVFYESDYICDLFLAIEGIQIGGIYLDNYIGGTFYFHDTSQSKTDGLNLYWPYWMKKIPRVENEKLRLYLYKRLENRLFRHSLFLNSKDQYSKKISQLVVEHIPDKNWQRVKFLDYIFRYSAAKKVIKYIFLNLKKLK